MSPRIPSLEKGVSTDRVTAALREHGAVIVEGVLDAELLARFNAELDPLLAATSPKRSYLNPAIEFFFGDRVRQITGLAARSRIFGEEVLCHPFYREVCDAILGPSCSSYQLNVARPSMRAAGTRPRMAGAAACT